MRDCTRAEQRCCFLAFQCTLKICTNKTIPENKNIPKNENKRESIALNHITASSLIVAHVLFNLAVVHEMD